MAEVLFEFSEPVTDLKDGTQYMARACGAETENGRWHGWVEFTPVDGGPVLRSARETTQPNRIDTLYWATGLTAVYLEGSLNRTRRPLVARPPQAPARPAFDQPAPDRQPRAAAVESVLNPFSVYRKGEALLRQQLAAFSAWHLVNIVRAYGLSDLPADELERLRAPELVELIVAAVRSDAGEPVGP